MNICKHTHLRYLERVCTDCGATFYICPVCCKIEPYSYCCLDCEKRARAMARGPVAQPVQGGF